MTFSFVILSMLTLAGAAAAMSQRRLIHCALLLAVAFAGLAGIYLNLGAEFAGLAQLLVYVGAIAILIVFAVLLTREGDEAISASSAFSGIGIALALFGTIAWCILRSSIAQRPQPTAPSATVNQIGDALMGRFILPLEILALMLTAALIGAVVLAMRDQPAHRNEPGGRS